MSAQEAIQAATPSMRDLAEKTGIKYSTLRAWSAGHRIPSTDGAIKLADELERRCGRLSALAGELRAAAKARGGG